MTSKDYENVNRFARLFQGRSDAFGTGRGQWVKRPLQPSDYADHLQGKGHGIGVAPLRDDGTVMFAAIDLDEPDFAAAKEMQDYIPGRSWIERSRSGNAHVWVFFTEPIDAWVARGILKEAILAAGKLHVEIFPKQDRLRPGMFGNYINLPFHGDTRPTLEHVPDSDENAERLPDGTFLAPQRLERFLEGSENTLSDPEDWKKKARWLLIEPPESRERTSEFGTQQNLHMCAEWIIAQRDEFPVVEGHRNAVFFALSKMLANWELCDEDEAWSYVQMVNNSSPDPAPESELRRILNNAYSGQWTSTDCDSPIVQPYTHPNCPIANKGNR